MSSRFDGPGILVIGASLAGLRACTALRSLGYEGRLTVIGDEPHPPYDRPPLSKEFLTQPAHRVDLPLPVGLDITWQLGRRATGLDLAARTVEMADGTRVPFDGLVIATGSTARPWPAAVPAGVHTLRSLDDAHALRKALHRGGGRLLVIGAGFIGSEISATARGAGLPVTLVEPQPQPLRRAVGEAAGGFVATLHRRAGVDLRTSTTVLSLTGDRKLTGARLSDGTDVNAAVAVLALGSLPSTDWLTGSGLCIEGGVLCDRHARALRQDGTPAPAVVAPPMGEEPRHHAGTLEQRRRASRNGRAIAAQPRGTRGLPPRPIVLVRSVRRQVPLRRASRACRLGRRTRERPRRTPTGYRLLPARPPDWSAHRQPGWQDRCLP